MSKDPAEAGVHNTRLGNQPETGAQAPNQKGRKLPPRPTHLWATVPFLYRISVTLSSEKWCEIKFL